MFNLLDLCLILGIKQCLPLNSALVLLPTLVIQMLIYHHPLISIGCILMRLPQLFFHYFVIL